MPSGSDTAQTVIYYRPFVRINRLHIQYTRTEYLFPKDDGFRILQNICRLVSEYTLLHLQGNLQVYTEIHVFFKQFSLILRSRVVKKHNKLFIA